MEISNKEFMYELDLQVVNGFIVSQETNDMVKNHYTGKYLIDYIEGTRVDWRYYEHFDILNNFKQLKSLVEWYIARLEIEEGRYFPIIATDTVGDTIGIVLKNETETVSSRYFPKEMGYLAYIDIIYALNEDYDHDLSIYMKNQL